MKSFFTISLDFELFWGMRDVSTIKKYGKNILGGRKAIPKILDCFQNYHIHSTWAMVGLATFENRDDLISFFPEIKPKYKNLLMDPYHDLSYLGDDEKSDPFHFGYSLVKMIQQSGNVELASHTFSHFYCLENEIRGAFASDLKASINSLKRIGCTPETLVFCRNRYNSEHLIEAKLNGFRFFRGTEISNLYSNHNQNDHNSLMIRLFRLFDAYVNLTGHHFSIVDKDSSGLINIPSSRFLRPWSSNLMQNIRLKRILNSMKFAAMNNLGFHLWWHPHNFGENVTENIFILNEICNYYKYLANEYGMESLTMSEAGRRLNSN